MKAILTLAIALALCAASGALAGSATWDANPISSDWGNPANWTTNTVPNGPNDRATFANSSITDVSLPAGATEVNSIGFDYHGDAFTITVGASDQGVLKITGLGVPNASPHGQNFIVRTPFTEALGFYNSAGAGEGILYTIENASRIGFHDSTIGDFAYFTVVGGDDSQLSGSQLNFYDSSGASNGYGYTTTGGSAPGAEGGTINFFNNSAGQNSEFTNKAATDPAAVSGGSMNFYDDSTGGNIITNESGPVTGGGGGRGSTVFWNNSVCYATVVCDGAQSAADQPGAVEFFDQSNALGYFILNGGSNGGAGGALRFSGSSTSTDADATLFGNATIDMTNLEAPGLQFAYVEGTGFVSLGSHNLALGGSFVATQFDGIIKGSGSLTKIGSSTITLTGANTYTGGTVITGGFLRVDNKQGSATGSGAVRVNSGTLGGGGIIAGPVTIGGRSGVGASIAPGTGAITLTLQNRLTFQTTGSYIWRIRQGGATADKVVAKGVTLKAGAQIQPLGQGRLAAGAVITAIDNTSSKPITGTFSNLTDGGTITVGNSTLQANYEGGDGNDLTLTVVP